MCTSYDHCGETALGEETEAPGGGRLPTREALHLLAFRVEPRGLDTPAQRAHRDILLCRQQRVILAAVVKARRLRLAAPGQHAFC